MAATHAQRSGLDFLIVGLGGEEHLEGGGTVMSDPPRNTAAAMEYICTMYAVLCSTQRKWVGQLVSPHSLTAICFTYTCT